MCVWGRSGRTRELLPDAASRVEEGGAGMASGLLARWRLFIVSIVSPRVCEWLGLSGNLHHPDLFLRLHGCRQ